MGRVDWRTKKKTPSRKNQIRSLRRLLSKEDLDAELRKSIESKLGELGEQVVDKQQEDLERKRAQRYHKVKFFERRKLMRRLEAVKKQLSKAADTSEVTTLKDELVRLDEDMTYVRYFPNDKKYISLFATDVDEATARRRERFRDLARQNKAAVLRGEALSQKDKRLRKAQVSASAAATTATVATSSLDPADSEGESAEEEEGDDDFFLPVDGDGAASDGSSQGYDGNEPSRGEAVDAKAPSADAYMPGKKRKAPREATAQGNPPSTGDQAGPSPSGEPGAASHSPPPPGTLREEGGNLAGTGNGKKRLKKRRKERSES
uniref:rRNA-processing protein EFG1 n=1 Tax=Rhizochromulina marina TaxID=1034831 RepID=A0A7S2RJF1_9STRA